MSTDVTHDDATPPAAPRHQCINASCGCNDLVSAGACAEWCMANTVEAGDVASGKAQPAVCNCRHETCIVNGAPAGGTPERGMA